MEYDIPLLDHDTRFSLWRAKMRDKLVLMGLGETLLGLENMSSSSTPDERQRKDQKAISIIRLHLSNNILLKVTEETTSAALWLKLESICMKKDLATKFRFIQKLRSHKLPEGGSLLDHLSQFKEIVTDIKCMGVKFSDEDLGIFLLISLPSSHSTFLDIFLFGRDTLALSDVYEALRCKAEMESMISNQGLAIHGRKVDKDSQQGNGNRSKMKEKYKSCKYCKKSGHNISECWKLQNKEKRANSNK